MAKLPNTITAPPHLSLESLHASELMTSNPVSIRDNASVDEAIRFLTDRGVSGAPVINESGRPVGVISRTDLLIHEREQRRLGKEIGPVDPTIVSSVMTPIVFTARPTDPAAKVIEQMVALNVHRLFVVDADGVLIGVVTPLDVLRRMTDRSESSS